MSQSLYLKVDRDAIGDYVLLTGDPARVDRIARLLDDSETIAKNREFYTITGSYKGKRFSGVSSGIGAPSAAIALEELTQLGVKAVVRVGTMMGVNAPMGSYVIASGAIRFEGTSSQYLPIEYPAVPDWRLVQSMIQSGQNHNLDTNVGITATYDAFYPKMAPALVSRGLPDMEALQQANVLALDMETSLLYVVGLRLKLPVVSMCIVTNTAEPFAILDADLRAQGEEMLITTVLDGLTGWDETFNE